MHVCAASLSLRRGCDEVMARHAACGEREMARRVVARGRHAVRAREESTAVGQRLHRRERGLGDDGLAFPDRLRGDERAFAVIRVAHASDGRPPATESFLERFVVVKSGGGGGRIGRSRVVVARAFPRRRL
jgi:hypothetical protein|tara:strand:- start:8110 stop:8502 length:393 start_codon:yes stop_codon:yes gene_type:complete